MALSSPIVASPPTLEVDDLVIARVRRGDEAAARTIFERYHGSVYAFVWRMLGPQRTAATAEDLVQDTFIRALAALPRFSTEGPASLSTWLLTIAIRLTLNELRRQRRRGTDVRVDDLAIAHPARTDEATERRALGQRLAVEIARLSEAHRAVLLLRDYHDLTYQEIATMLGIDLGTVQSRLSRARAALRAALEDLR